VTIETSDEREVELGTFMGSSLVLYLFPGTQRSLFEGPRSRQADTEQQVAFGAHTLTFEKDHKLRTLGISTQAPHELAMSEHTHGLGHYLLSDQHLRLKDALPLPTFRCGETPAFHRVALVVRHGIIEKALLAGTPGGHAEQVKTWLALR
jgi:peroxiredoxin